ncbi:nitroimidazol reductase NimA-like FMN-containing flavoprotein (pyridoxamine 5'-phosphate oxidase superfamily) [Kibdelosporangium banguiense]|uniref:Nitroimidazol reductase NimA-like FMN-containing flavoprotein (Pyridoxamine 5'-phosphate oxidase superfamily) n=1 Tax=Kibdelosporangium banguiense TaxID=1365924 RepID=A0ABS4TQJ7_9PSEU|nr:hypothetical protein [Kibdelosporangium banguiense]MBP2326684.1 nitroimidazol reductase NimA-like FMN-containing flavoprotein (pyridoxamine 5'-phosphate oxidase superfamily) [Kibdelosporangium banguiense]
MRKSLTRLLLVACGVLLALFSTGLGQAQAATNTGGLDLDTYCRSTGNISATTVGSTAYDWRCVTPQGQLVPISMTDVCRVQRGADTIDRTYNFFSTGSWECWRTGGNLGGLDLNRHCRSTGNLSATTVGSTAYDWRCVTPQGQLVPISMTNACQTQRGINSIDRFNNFYNSSSWECWS